MQTIIVSGFEPFHGHDINPSLEIARALNGMEIIDGIQVQACQLPVVRGEAFPVLHSAIEKWNPIAV